MTEQRSAEPGPVDARLPHHPLTARDKAKEHGLAERSNDLDVIMPTVSAWDQHFAVLSHTPDGEFHLQLATDTEEVRRFYVDRLKSWSLVTSYGENDVYSRWFKLTDTRGEMTMLATGTVERNRVAVLFPAWTDGIIGEITWTEPPWAVPHLSKEQRIGISLQLDAFDAAWRAGDLDARLATVEDKTCSVLRVAEVNGGRRSLAAAWSKRELREAWASPAAGRVVEFERRFRLTTNTYVFASYRMTLDLDGRLVERETAVILPLGPNLKFVGELSYSMEAGR
jgi:hypothetical protein